MNKNWQSFGALSSAVATILDARNADQTPPSREMVFDAMVAICAIAEPEETLSEEAGVGTINGALILYEDEEGAPAQAWTLEIWCGDGGFTLTNGITAMNFSHEEPEWEPRTVALLERTWWRPLNWERFLSR